MGNKESSAELRLTIVYDNNPPLPDVTGCACGCTSAWGFSCLIEVGDSTILFDTGGDGPTLLGNMEALSIDPMVIDVIVLSHYHWDHIGGLEALLGTGIRPAVYVPMSFPADFRVSLATRVPVVEVTGPAVIAGRVSTTGEMGSAIVEQSLCIGTDRGPVVVTGCAHPGIVEIIGSVAESEGAEFVIGGFHLKDASQDRCDQVVAEFQRLGVRRMAPTHCTGALAIERFKKAFGDCCLPVGLGSVIELEGLA